MKFNRSLMETHENIDKKTNPNKSIIIDRGLARSGIKIHGVNPALLIEKILREKIQDSHYWHIKVSNLEFFELLDECVNGIQLIGTYSTNSKTKVCKFIVLLFKLLQFDKIDIEIVKWIISGDHGFKYLTVLFMLYARIIWEDSILIWNTLELKLNDYRKIRIINSFGIVTISHIDEIADLLLENDKFIDMALPRISNRWVLEERMDIGERESELMDEFEDEINENE